MPVGVWHVLCLQLALMLGGIPPTHAIELPAEQGVHASTRSWPRYYEVNKGQAPANIKFLRREHGYVLLLSPAEVVLRPNRDFDLLAASGADPMHGHEAGLRIRFAGSDPRARIAGQRPLRGKSHYFVGGRSSDWITGVSHFGAVEYKQIYPGVDIFFHADSTSVEFDFILEAGADPGAVRIETAGARHVGLADSGDLVLETDSGNYQLHAPKIYQKTRNGTALIDGGFILLDGDKIGMRVGRYDVAFPLVIDPVLTYSSYAGGSGTDEAHGVAVDAAGNVYLSGNTTSPDFPTMNPYQSGLGGFRSAFVMKLDPAGELVYATYIGNDVAEARGIALDAEGSVYLTGSTSSTTFPLVNPFQSVNRGLIDAFALKLSATGDHLWYSTYLGGRAIDRGRSIAVDTAGYAYITGATSSTNFPVANAFQGTHAGNVDAYITRLNPAGGSLSYSTFLGGAGSDYAYAISVNVSGEAFVTGYTNSAGFPLFSPLQNEIVGGNDAFVTKLDAAGSPVYSSFWGGSGDDTGSAITLNDSGHIYLAGQTTSDDLTMLNAWQPVRRGGTDAFLARFDPTGANVEFSTYLGGNSNDDAYAVTVDAAGGVYLAGATESADFPQMSPVQGAFGGVVDAFVAKLTASGALGYSTYLGGVGNDRVRAIVADAGGDVYVAGITGSTNFPVPNGQQTIYGGGTTDAFVSILRQDSDGDGLLDYRERALGTNPYSPDTDGDGLADGAEVDIHGTSPFIVDTDGDGLTDGGEVNMYGTNPNVSNKGDVAPAGAPDGQVNLVDLLVLVRFVEGMAAPSARDRILGDMNSDGVLDVRDVLLLRRGLGY